MIYSKFNYSHCPSNIICFTGSDISDEMIEACFKIDEDFFEEKYFYEKTRVRNRIKEYNEFCFIFYDLRINKVIGYNFMVLLDMSAFDKYLKGEVSYFTIGANQFVNKSKNASAALFYLSSAFTPNLNISLMAKMVQNAVTDLIINYKLTRNIKIEKYFLDAVCKFDEEYSKFIKLKFYKQTAYGSKIYIEDFNPRTFFPNAVNFDILNKAYEL